MYLISRERVKAGRSYQDARDLAHENAGRPEDHEPARDRIVEVRVQVGVGDCRRDLVFESAMQCAAMYRETLAQLCVCVIQGAPALSYG